MLRSPRIKITRVFRADAFDGGEDAGVVKGPLMVKAYQENSDRARTLMETEVRALRKLASSPFVLRLFFEDRKARLPRLGLELCERGDLYTLLHKEASFSELEVGTIATELAVALDHLADKGIVHCDIKPEHIGLTSQNHIKLLDFSRSEDLSETTSVPHTSGTLPYASPEVLELRHCTLSSDWFALGVIVFEMIFGELPFWGKTDEDTAHMVCSDPIKFPRSTRCSEGAKLFIAHCLTKDPNQRLHSLQGCHGHKFFAETPWAQIRQGVQASEI